MSDELRKLDAEVAVEVMGWSELTATTLPPCGTRLFCPPGEVRIQRIEPLPTYSTDLNAAAEAEREIERRGWCTRTWTRWRGL